MKTNSAHHQKRALFLKILSINPGKFALIFISLKVSYSWLFLRHFISENKTNIEDNERKKPRTDLADEKGGGDPDQANHRTARRVRFKGGRR